MKKFTVLSLILAIFTLCISAAHQIPTIDTSGAVEVYRNTFDDADSLNDFTMYSGKWGIENGRAYVLPKQTAANAYFVYTGENEALQNLSDYVVSVEMYNVRQATGLVARCDLASCSTAIHGYMGINAACQTNGTYFFTRVTNNANGKSTDSLGSAPVVFAPGANIRLEVAMRGKIVQTTAYDIDTGLLLWSRSGVTDLHPSGSFGLMAYTKVVNGLDVSETRFDNLVVKTLPALPEGESATIELETDGILPLEDLSFSDGTVEAQLFMPAAATKNDLEAVLNDKREDRAGIVFNRSEDGLDFYCLQIYRKTYVSKVTDGAIGKITNNVYLVLYKVEDGMTTTLEEFYLEASGLGSWGVVALRAVVKDGKIYGYMNDRCYVSVTDENPLSGTGVALLSGGTDKNGSISNYKCATFANVRTSDVTECDKADIVIWGHSHMGAWVNAIDEFNAYGNVVNLGLGGSSTLDMPNIVDEMATYDPKVAIIMIGSNNMGYTVEKNVSDLDQSFDMLRELCPDVKFILITEWWQPSRLEAYGDYVLSLNEAYRAYAAENDDVTIVEGWSIPVKNGKLDESMFRDTQHLNPAAYLLLDKRTHSALDYLINGNMGDVNEDGLVSITDSISVLKYALNEDDNYPISCDRNFDGQISVLDAIKVLKHIAA